MSIGHEFLFTFAVEELLKKVGSAATDEVTRILGAKKDLKKLSETSKKIQLLLREAEDKQATDDRVNPWLVKLQDVICSADDVLDDFSYEIQRRKIEIGDQFKRSIRSYLVCGYNPVSFRRQIANKVKEINETLAEIEKQAISELALKAAVGAGSGAAAIIQPDQMGTHSLLDESSPPIGRTKELENISNFIEEKSSSHDLKFVCIVGFGGLGKTTLAKMVYSEVKRKNLFDVTTWIDVSKTSNAVMILGEMLQKVDPSSGKSNNIDTILESLREKLQEKTFLLVLDNVWNKQDTDWLNLEKSLSLISKSNRNSVIMTTRITELASVMGTSCRCLVELQELSDDECWSIIKGKVFGKGEESVVPEDLKTIGVEIAKKCRGVPLVANVVGGMLRSKRDSKEWESLRDSNMWQGVKENNILPVLRLSFDHLPSHLKQCFAYCSLFPKNFVFDKGQLIQLWMAEGFLHKTSENASTSKSANSMEEIGDKYFDELWANSFFQNVEVDKWGNILRCKMHDLIHDLAISVSNKRQQDGSSSHGFRKHDIRRISFFFDDEEHPKVEDYARDEMRRLRSLHANREILLTMFDLKSLRSLNLQGADYEELPAAIGVLKYLRYLDNSNNVRIKELPESITKLYNLQTLRVIRCPCLTKVPSKIGNIVSLRHIHIDDCRFMSFKVESLTNLRTLPLFVVGQEEGCKIQELQHLNELRGKLKIYNLQHVSNRTEALAANLKGKKLSKLRLIWVYGSRNCNHEEVLEGLQPPESIMSLTIDGYMGKLFPEWMSMKERGSVSPLNQLVKLKLLGCKKCEIMPTLVHLPRLKILEIEKCHNLISLPIGLTSLEDLRIHLCDKLESISSSQDLVSLKRMRIHFCKNLTSLPEGLVCIEELNMRNCNDLRTVPSHLASLKILEFHTCPGLTLPHGLKSLKHLTIYYIYNLSADAFRGLSSLEFLQIRSIWGMDLMPSVEDLTSLKTLKIEKCTSLKSLTVGLHLLKCLENLAITVCKWLKAIETDTISSLTQLETLKLGPFSYKSNRPIFDEYGEFDNRKPQRLRLDGRDKIKSLPYLGHLTALKNLEIAYFEISELPLWLGEVIQDLRS